MQLWMVLKPEVRKENTEQNVLNLTKLIRLTFLYIPLIFSVNLLTLKILFSGEDDETDYLYVIKIKTLPIAQVKSEYIEDKFLKENSHIKYFTVTPDNNFNKSGLKTLIHNINIADLEENKISYEMTRDELVPAKEYEEQYLPLKIRSQNSVSSILNNILVLNPIPSKMRDYSRLSENIEGDGSNIAGVLAALPEEQKTEVESNLSYYIKDLPEGDIKKVFAEPVGRLKTDAMLYCEEKWKPGEITEIDARTMSDGTLRFLAILTALLTRPEGSQIVIEEIDNGLHPSRATLLVKILKEIGSKRNIDILLTTHNPALLDAFGPEIVPFVVVAHRDSETGESKLTLLEDIENLPLLLASGTLGKLATKGAIEKSLSNQK
ncbi:MAG: ATP-binding protein [Nostocales cyanobacterium ELA583]